MLRLHRGRLFAAMLPAYAFGSGFGYSTEDVALTAQAVLCFVVVWACVVVNWVYVEENPCRK